MTGPVSRSELERGATELVSNCLAVGPGDRVLVLTDEQILPLASIIRDAAMRLAETRMTLLPSANTDYEAAFAAASAALSEQRPTVTVLAVNDDRDLFAWDPRFHEILGDLEVRHAQMPALDALCLGVGMATDYSTVAEWTAHVLAEVGGARRAHITCALGTDVVFELDPRRPWTGFDGLYRSPGRRGRLPQGEVFCSPLSADGTIAASVLGYPFNASTGLLRDPVRFTVREGRLVAIDHPDGGLRSRLGEWFSGARNGDRVGELAFGTNRALRELVGKLLFDENVPGCHIAFGHPFGDYTGADWHSGIHVDVVVARPTIALDGRSIIVDGAYPQDFDPEPEKGEAHAPSTQ